MGVVNLPYQAPLSDYQTTGIYNIDSPNLVQPSYGGYKPVDYSYLTDYANNPYLGDDNAPVWVEPTPLPSSVTSMGGNYYGSPTYVPPTPASAYVSQDMVPGSTPNVITQGPTTASYVNPPAAMTAIAPPPPMPTFSGATPATSSPAPFLPGYMENPVSPMLTYDSSGNPVHSNVTMNSRLYATQDSANQLAQMLGATVGQTVGTGPGGDAPPMYNLNFAGAPDPLNAGLVGQQIGYATQGRLNADTGQYEPDALKDVIARLNAEIPGASPLNLDAVASASGYKIPNVSQGGGGVTDSNSSLFSMPQGATAPQVAPNQKNTPGAVQTPQGGVPLGDNLSFIPKSDPPQLGGSFNPYASILSILMGAEEEDVHQFLANQANNMGYLQGIASNAGYPTNIEPAWQAMVQAQQRNIDRGLADLNAAFGRSGNRFSTGHTTATNDYMIQAIRDQNATLGQMWTAAQEGARQRELAAAQGLGQYAFQGPSQLSAQEFQGGQLSNQLGLQAAMQLAGGADAASMALLQNAMQAAGMLSGTENQAANNMFAAQIQGLQQQQQYDQFLRSLGLQGATSLSNLWNQNLNTGLNIGNNQYGILQNEIDRMYQEHLRTSPEYNPLLQMMFSGATGYPPVYSPQYQPSQLPAILGGIGSIAGGLPAFLKMLGLVK